MTGFLYGGQSPVRFESTLHCVWFFFQKIYILQNPSLKNGIISLCHLTPGSRPSIRRSH